MSSILKALKKVEQQKSPRPRFELDVAAGIVREKTETKQRPWIVPTAMAAVALLAALTTYGIMAMNPGKTFPEKQVIAKQDISAPAVVPATSSVPSSPAASAAPPAQSPSRLPAVTAPPAAPTQPTAQTRPALVPPSAARLAPRQPEATHPRKIQLPSAPPASIPAERKTEPSPVASTMPNLKLTGIAWQKDSASRLAVVNGSAVSQGAMVEGAKIEEILPDKVRFSMGQRTFEISLGKIQN